MNNDMYPNTLSWPEAVTALTALYFAIQAYYGYWKAAPYSRDFWFPHVARSYRLYRSLGGTTRLNEIIKQIAK